MSLLRQAGRRSRHLVSSDLGRGRSRGEIEEEDVWGDLVISALGREEEEDVCSPRRTSAEVEVGIEKALVLAEYPGAW